MTSATPTRRKRGACFGFEVGLRLEDGIGELVEWVRSQTASGGVPNAVGELTARGLAR